MDDTPSVHDQSVDVRCGMKGLKISAHVPGLCPLVARQRQPMGADLSLGLLCFSDVLGDPPAGLRTFFLVGMLLLLGAPGIATRSKDATGGSWPYYYEQEATRDSARGASRFLVSQVFLLYGISTMLCGPSVKEIRQAYSHLVPMQMNSRKLLARASLLGERVAVCEGHLPVASLLLVAMPGAPSSFLLLVAMPGLLVASLLLVAMPGAPSSFLLLVAMPGARSSFLLLVAMPGAPSSFLLLVAMPGAPSSFLLLVAMPGALVASLLLVAMPGALVASLLLVAMPGALVASLLLVAMPGAPSSFLLLVAMPGAPSSFLLLVRVGMPGAPTSFLFLGAMPGATSSVLAPSGVWITSSRLQPGLYEKALYGAEVEETVNGFWRGKTGAVPNEEAFSSLSSSDQAKICNIPLSQPLFTAVPWPKEETSPNATHP